MSSPSARNIQLVYQSVNKKVLESVPCHVRNILDIGCGGGGLGEALKMKINCKVTGLTFSEDEGRLASASLDKVLIVDLNYLCVSSLGKYDCIVCSHVLEHLYKPETLLRGLADHCLTPEGVLVVALPNVLYWKQRLQFLFGRFRYTLGGIMDETHYRFYDYNTASELICNTGYQIISRRSDGIFPFSRLLGRRMSQVVDHAALTMFPGFFGNQFIITAKKNS
jgi:2-polyprenyl-3-methyl-5-hydroxy-6-metoxy-1,4-benzoquinol methylase